jgi:hypothetical protein
MERYQAEAQADTVNFQGQKYLFHPSKEHMDYFNSNQRNELKELNSIGLIGQ